MSKKIPLTGGIADLVKNAETLTPGGIFVPKHLLPTAADFRPEGHKSKRETSDYTPNATPWRVPIPFSKRTETGDLIPVPNRLYHIRSKEGPAGAHAAMGMWMLWEKSRDPMNLVPGGQVMVEKMTEREYMDAWAEAKRFEQAGKGRLLFRMCEGEPDNPAVFTLISDTDEHYWKGTDPHEYVTQSKERIEL